MQSAEVKKVFAKLEEIEGRLNALDSNGELQEIKDVLNRVAADWKGVKSVVENQGNVTARMERVLTRLELRCPLMKPATDEFAKVVEPDG